MISFKWRQFEKSLILMLVRWYLAYSLSYRDIEELAADRKKYKRAVNGSWRMDETYLKIKGENVYLYRAVDKHGNTIDFKLSKKRDKKEAFTYFSKCIGQHGLPEKVTMDKSGANKAGIDLINLQLTIISLLTGIFCQIEVRQIKYLNNIVEQDHRGIKRITKSMLGFKNFDSAEATLAGIELHRMLRKKQHVDAANKTIFEQFYGLAA